MFVICDCGSGRDQNKFQNYFQNQNVHNFWTVLDRKDLNTVLESYEPGKFDERSVSQLWQTFYSTYPPPMITIIGMLNVQFF